VNGQRGHVRVTFVGAGLGLGVNVSATASSAGFKDPYLFINPSSFNGEGWIASAGVALPGAATPAVAVGRSPDQTARCWRVDRRYEAGRGGTIWYRAASRLRVFDRCVVRNVYRHFIEHNQWL